MFVGHLALAVAAKRAVPAAPLGWLVAAVTALDLLWPVFLLAGIEQVRISPGATAFTPLIFEWYPWSHSLVMAVAWGGFLAVLARWRGLPGRVGSWLAGLVVSHWVLDFLTHAPDLPLWPGDSPRLGLRAVELHLRDHRDRGTPVGRRNRALRSGLRGHSLDRARGPVVARGSHHGAVARRAVVASTARPTVPGLVCIDPLGRGALGGPGGPALRCARPEVTS